MATSFEEHTEGQQYCAVRNNGVDSGIRSSSSRHPVLYSATTHTHDCLYFVRYDDKDDIGIGEGWSGAMDEVHHMHTHTQTSSVGSLSCRRAKLEGIEKNITFFFLFFFCCSCHFFVTAGDRPTHLPYSTYYYYIP